jgi:hypothetical protein
LKGCVNKIQPQLSKAFFKVAFYKFVFTENSKFPQNGYTNCDGIMPTKTNVMTYEAFDVVSIRTSIMLWEV